MVAIVNTGTSPRLLQEGVNAIADMELRDYSPEYTNIFEMKGSSKAYELDVSMSPTGMATLKPEGGATTYDAEKQDWITSYQPKVYSLGTIITMEAQMHNLYRDLVSKAGKILKRSLVHTDEQLAANVINNAYTAGATAIGDGLAIFSTAHLLGKGGTFSNRFTSFTPLSRVAIEDATIAIEDFRDGAGLLVDARVSKLHIPRQLRHISTRIDKSAFEPNSANTATVNPVSGIFPGGIHINHRFTSNQNWFIQTDVDDGFKIFDLMKYTFSQDNDFGTENFRTKGMFYKSYGLTSPRACWGSGN